MPLPPTIPTSFVPRPSASSRPGGQGTDFTGALGFLAYGILALLTVAAIGLFAYGRILSTQKDARDAELAKKEASINSKTADMFVRLQNRLQSGKALIAGHVALSRFFNDLDTLIPTGVRFTSLGITPSAGAPAKLTAAGSARTFNQVAVLSSNFAADGNVKDAIFSNLTVEPKDGSVSFSLTASVDPALIAFSAEAVAQAALSNAAAAATSSTATTTTP